MTTNKSTFGLDAAVAAKLNWGRALQRTLHDTRSDFIYAPHLNAIYADSAEPLIAKIKNELNSGKYSPGIPLNIEVPKTTRIRVSSAKKFGPHFSRPGSILLPKDRLLYQVIADQAAPLIDKKTDHDRSFSQRIAPPESETPFLSPSVCWDQFQKAVKTLSSIDHHKYVMKIDVSNCFGNVNQHNLVNDLSDSGLESSLVNILEQLLLKYTGDRSSRGILQGLYPSDLFGNFYLNAVDRHLSDMKVPSARYVDDIYVFAESVESSEHLLRELTSILRTYDLSLNEGKSFIAPKSAMSVEEPDLEELFANALKEIQSELVSDTDGGDYGIPATIEDFDNLDDPSLKADIELIATELLFDSISDYPGKEDSIERFCIPAFARAGSNYAIEYVIDKYASRPSQAQIFSAYLSRFLSQDYVRESLLVSLQDPGQFDWQRMWAAAALLGHLEYEDAAVKIAWDVFKDGNRHDALRALAAIFVGKFGDHGRRKALVAAYMTAGSAYIQSAIYYSAKWFPTVERQTAVNSWGQLNELNELITAAVLKKPS